MGETVYTKSTPRDGVHVVILAVYFSSSHDDVVHSARDTANALRYVNFLDPSVREKGIRQLDGRQKATGYIKVRRRAVNQAFVERMTRAIPVAKMKGAIINTEGTIAQAALESGWGLSGLTRRANGLFGFKAGTTWTGLVYFGTTYEHEGGRYIKYPGTGKLYGNVAEALEAARLTSIPEGTARVAFFRGFLSWNECIVDYWRQIQRLWWFRDALPHADPPHGDGNAEQWIAKLVDKDVPGEMKWATSPNYVAKVMGVAAEIRGGDQAADLSEGGEA